jgi:hypothetical protein
MPNVARALSLTEFNEVPYHGHTSYISRCPTVHVPSALRDMPPRLNVSLHALELWVSPIGAIVSLHRYSTKKMSQ